MRFFTLFAIGAVALGTAACAPRDPGPFAWVSQDAADDERLIALAPDAAPFFTAFEDMTTALPEFSLQRGYESPLSYGEVSVVRDVSFEADGVILSQIQVERLASVQRYLRANPATTVRIVVHGDAFAPAERVDYLVNARAQAVVRALTVDTRVNNAMVIDARAASRQSDRGRSAEIVLVMPPSASYQGSGL